MNKLVLGVSLLITVLLSQHAAADSRHGRQGYNDSQFGRNHFRGSNRSHNRDFNRRGNRSYSRAAANPYHYGRAGNRRGNDFLSISYGNGFYNNRFNNNFYNNGYRNRWSRNRNRNRNNSNFVGGLVLGSLLSGQNYSSRSYDTVRYRAAPARETVVREREIVYVNSSARAPVSATPKRRLLRDLQGDCYQIEVSPNGDELRSQIDPATCDF